MYFKSQLNAIVANQIMGGTDLVPVDAPTSYAKQAPQGFLAKGWRATKNFVGNHKGKLGAVGTVAGIGGGFYAGRRSNKQTANEMINFISAAEEAGNNVTALFGFGGYKKGLAEGRRQGAEVARRAAAHGRKMGAKGKIGIGRAGLAAGGAAAVGALAGASYNRYSPAKRR